MKRIISCVASDFQKEFADNEIKEAILASEGRVIMAQTTANNETVINGVSNAELLASFGTDMILLKVFDVESPCIKGIETNDNVIKKLKRLTGRLIGINLEVIGANNLKYNGGTVLSEETIKKTVELQPDYICLTAYRNKPGNDSEAIMKAIQLVRKYFKGLLILNKYYSSQELKNEKAWKKYIENGADIITLPMPGSVPGVYVENLAPIAEKIKEYGGLVSMAVSTSQEGCDENTMKTMAIQAKQAGADLYDFGDANTNGIPAPENILTLSIVIRGKRHTYFRLGSSICR